MEHTFTTGRTATLRDALPMHVLMRRAVAAGEDDLLVRIQQMADGKLADADAALRIQDALVTAMWVHPRIVGMDEIAGPDAISIEDLSDEEMAETLDLAMQGVVDSAGFRDKPASPGRGTRSKAVAGTAKPRTRATAGKR